MSLQTYFRRYKPKPGKIEKKLCFFGFPFVSTGLSKLKTSRKITWTISNTFHKNITSKFFAKFWFLWSKMTGL